MAFFIFFEGGRDFQGCDESDVYLSAMVLHERKELQFLEPVEEDRWWHKGKRNEHMPPRSLAQNYTLNLHSFLALA